MRILSRNLEYSVDGVSLASFYITNFFLYLRKRYQLSCFKAKTNKLSTNRDSLLFLWVPHSWHTANYHPRESGMIIVQSRVHYKASQKKLSAKEKSLLALTKSVFKLSTTIVHENFSINLREKHIYSSGPLLCVLIY